MYPLYPPLMPFVDVTKVCHELSFVTVFSYLNSFQIIACNSYHKLLTTWVHRYYKYDMLCQILRITPKSVADPGFPVGRGVDLFGGGGMDLRRRCFFVKMYAKMKELGPVGGGWGRAPDTQ